MLNGYPPEYAFHIDKDILEECLDFLKKEYIPAASGSGFLFSPRLRRILPYDENIEGENYSVQFKVKNVDTLNYWLAKEGAEMHKQLTGRFGQKVVGFSTLLEELAIEDA